MNIWLLAENWPPRRGGIESYLTHIARFLMDKSVTVIAPIAEADDTPVGGIKEIIRQRFFIPFIRPKWWLLYRFLKKKAAQEKPDIIFCGKALFEGLAALRLKHAFGIPYVVFTYAMEIETWQRNSRTKNQLTRVLQNANRVVYINEVTKKSLLHLGVMEQQLVKIWPGVDDSLFQEVSEQTIKAVTVKYGIPQPYIFCLSRLVPRKGIDVLIEGFKEVRGETKLVIAGSGAAEQKLREQVRNIGLQNQVVFLGSVPDEDLPALYAGASVFALTPRRDEEDIEGFGIVYIEAAAHGVPAVGTLVGGVPEAVTHNETGILVQPDNPQAIQEALEMLLRQADKRKSMGAAAKKRAWEEFRWSKRIMLVKGVIDAVLMG